VVLGAFLCGFLFFFSSRRRHTRSKRDWSSDVCSSDLTVLRNFLFKEIFKGCCLLFSYQGSCRSLFATALIFYQIFFALSRTFLRSEERRVGKECRCGWSTYGGRENKGGVVGKEESEEQ